jgi:hypothetical protein
MADQQRSRCTRAEGSPVNALYEQLQTRLTFERKQAPTGAARCWPTYTDPHRAVGCMSRLVKFSLGVAGS